MARGLGIGPGGLKKSLSSPAQQMQNTGLVMNMFSGARSFVKGMVTGDFTGSMRQSLWDTKHNQAGRTFMSRLSAAEKTGWGGMTVNQRRVLSRSASTAMKSVTGQRTGFRAAMNRKATMMRAGQIGAGVAAYAGITSLTDTDFTTKLGFGAGYAYGLRKFGGGRFGGLRALGMGAISGAATAPIF